MKEKNKEEAQKEPLKNTDEKEKVSIEEVTHDVDGNAKAVTKKCRYYITGATASTKIGVHLFTQRKYVRFILLNSNVR